MSLIQKDHGKLVIDFIEKNLHQKLPKVGIIAGQSVCSVLLYLLGKSPDIIINDYDIFYPTHKRRGSWNFRPQTYTSEVKVVAAEVQRENSFITLKNAGKVLLARKEEVDLYGNPDSGDEYSDAFTKPYRGNLYRRTNSLNFYENKFFKNEDTYRIEQVFRKELLNFVFVSAPFIDWNTPHPMVVINSFDINCTQVAIDLATKKIYFTKQFSDFLESKQLIVLKTNRPDHTFIRYMQKKALHGYYGNDDHAAQTCSTYKSLFQPEQMKVLREIEIPWRKDLNPDALYEKKLSEFGMGYIDKFKVSKNIGNFALLETREIKVRQWKQAHDNDNDIRRALLSARGIQEQSPTYLLGSLDYRGTDSEYILNGEHREKLMKQLNIGITGYIYFARANVSNILMEKYGIGKSKIHQRRVQILTSKNINTRTKFDHQLLMSLNADPVFFRGSSTLEQRTRTSQFINKHKDIRFLYTGLNIEESQQLTKLLLTLEKKYPEYLYMIEFNKIFEWQGITREEMFSILQSDYKIYQKKIERMSILKDNPDFETEHRNGFEIIELTSQGQLNDESKALKHCVKIYGRRIREKSSFVISFRSEENNLIRFTLELKLDINNTYREIQFRGIRNSKPTPFINKIKDDWLKAINDKILLENEKNAE